MSVDRDGRDWCWCAHRLSPSRVAERQDLWDDILYRIWLAETDSVGRVPGDRQQLLDSSDIGSPDHMAYVATAGRVADVLTQDVLLTPSESSVIPLPRQIRALSRPVAERIPPSVLEEDPKLLMWYDQALTRTEG